MVQCVHVESLAVCCYGNAVGTEPDSETAMNNLQHYTKMITDEDNEMRKARQVINPNPQLRNERVLEGVRAAPDYNDYERLCRGEQLLRQVSSFDSIERLIDRSMNQSRIGYCTARPA